MEVIGQGMHWLRFHLPTGSLSLGVDSSTTTILTVQNLGNAQVSGTLDAFGQDTGLVVLEWQRMSDDQVTTDYTLDVRLQH